MKIIGVYLSNKDEAATRGNTLVWPDSAMVRSGKPLFLPDSSPQAISIGFGAVITGVGKTIQPKFASRYFDSLMPMAFRLNKADSLMISQGISPLASGFVEDFSVLVGNPTAVTGLEAILELRISLSDRNENPIFNDFTKIDDWMLKMHEAIAAASVRNTLKTGDIVAFISDTSLAVHPENRLRVSFGDTGPLLDIKFK